MGDLLIVGAGSGLGLAMKERLASDGHRIWTMSRRPPVADEDTHRTWDATRDPFPVDFLPEQLDGLIYCPGSIRLQTFDRLGDEAFRDDWELNLLGAVRAIRGSLPALKAAAPGASIVLVSTVAVMTGMPMHASIAAAKGAVEGLTRSLAAEFAPDIRVNAIAPSLTDTPLAARLLRTDRQREAAAGRHPLGRIGRPEDLAAAARFLLSKEAEWVTGQVLTVDGGLGALRKFG